MIVAQEGCPKRESKLAQEVCEKDEAVFEDAEHGQLASVVSRADLRRKRAHALGDLRRAENFYEPFIHQELPREPDKRKPPTRNGAAQTGFILNVVRACFNHFTVKDEPAAPTLDCRAARQLRHAPPALAHEQPLNRAHMRRSYTPQVSPPRLEP